MDRVKRYHKALAAADLVIRDNPEDPAAHHNKGVVLEKLGRFNEALDSFHQAIKYKPNFARAYYNIGRTLRSMGKYKEAINAFDKAAEIKPNIPIIYNQRSAALIDLGASLKPEYSRSLFEAAIRDAEKTIELSSASEGFYNLACANAHLKNYEDALEALGKCKIAKGVEFDALHAWEDTDFNELRKPPYLKNFERIVGPKPSSAHKDIW